MAIKKITGIAEIDSIANALGKKFSKENMITMGPRYLSCDTFSTGSLVLDQQLGINGIPTNRIVEIFGPPSAGKTSFALQLVREYVAKYGYERPPCFIDLERTTSLELIRGFGLDPDKMIFAYPDNAEEAMQLAKDLGLSNKVGLIIFDSVDAAQSEAETKRLMNETGVGELPRIMSKSLRNLSRISADLNVTYIFINQIRMKIGVMFGNPETTSGGNALPFYASIRLRITSKASPTYPDALLMKVKVVKNKMAPALSRQAQFSFFCGKGTDKVLDLIDCAKETNLLRFAGRAVIAKMPDGKEETICTGGKIGARSFIADNKEFQESLRRACLSGSSLDGDGEPSRTIVS